MQRRLPRLVGAVTLMLFVLSCLAAAPARAACAPNAAECFAPPYSVPAEPVWATLNAVTQSNYPGGNETFDIFVINSDVPPDGNVTLINETVTAPTFPLGFQTNTAKGLPVQLAPGQAIMSTIPLEIPSSFSQSNFTADLAAYVQYWNGNTNINLTLTGNLKVFMLGSPISSTTTTSLTGSQMTETTTQSGTVSTPLFEAGVAIPSIVVVILLALLVRGRGGPKGGH